MDVSDIQDTDLETTYHVHEVDDPDDHLVDHIEPSEDIEPEEDDSSADTNVYKLKGKLMRTKSGKMVPTKLFDFLEIPLDDCADLEFSLSEIRRIRLHVMKMRTGVQAMAPILCPGPQRCLFSQRCPIVDRSKLTSDNEIDFQNQDMKKFPLMKQCIFERDFINFKMQQYLEEYKIDEDSPTEMGLLSRLAELDLYEYRITLVLAHGDDQGQGQDLLKVQMTGVDKQGDVITKLECHPIFEMKERIHRMRDKILESMIGTRKEKLKQIAVLKNPGGKDVSTVISDLRSKIQGFENDNLPRREDSQVIDAEILDQTEPIDDQQSCHSDHSQSERNIEPIKQ